MTPLVPVSSPATASGGPCGCPHVDVVSLPGPKWASGACCREKREWRSASQNRTPTLCRSFSDGVGETPNSVQQPDFRVPTRLLGAGNGMHGEGPVTYTVTLSTSLDRGASLSDPLSGVWLCLMSETAALLHRLAPVADPHYSARPSSSDADRAQAPAGRRFQQGAADELRFSGPDLGGPITAAIVGAESGTWTPSGMTVASSSSPEKVRLAFGPAKGDSGGALLATPIPADAVVYGEGPGAVVLTPAQAEGVRIANLADYEAMKGRILALNAALAAAGAAAAGIWVGWPAGAIFAVGGGSGLLYQSLLQRGVDAVGKGPSGGLAGTRDGSDSVTSRGWSEIVLASRWFRYAALGGAAAALAWAIGAIGDVGPDVREGGGREGVGRMLLFFAGFWTHKAAVVGVGMLPNDRNERRALRL